MVLHVEEMMNVNPIYANKTLVLSAQIPVIVEMVNIAPTLFVFLKKEIGKNVTRIMNASVIIVTPLNPMKMIPAGVLLKCYLIH